MLMMAESLRSRHSSLISRMICRDVFGSSEAVGSSIKSKSGFWISARQIMRLIKELCLERKLSAIINIHDVMLAQMFAERIVGLRLGEIVYDGPPTDLTPEVLTKIYGEEDWSATIHKVDEDAEETEASNVISLESRQPHRDRMAGLT